jgi:hypothetical protein
MRKKGITIWILTTLTFVSLIHLIEAITVIMLNNPIRLTLIYPFIGDMLTSMPSAMYLYLSALSTAILWGGTCLIAFHNPVENYLYKRTTTEAQMQDKGELLDRIYETMESDHEALAQLKDIVRNVQTEVKELKPSKQISPQKAETPETKTQLNPPTLDKPANTTAAKTQKKTMLKTTNKNPKKNGAGKKATFKTRTLSMSIPTRK